MIFMSGVFGGQIKNLKFCSLIHVFVSFNALRGALSCTKTCSEMHKPCNHIHSGNRFSTIAQYFVEIVVLDSSELPNTFKTDISQIITEPQPNFTVRLIIFCGDRMSFNAEIFFVQKGS